MLKLGFQPRPEKFEVQARLDPLPSLIRPRLVFILVPLFRHVSETSPFSLYDNHLR